MTPSALKKRCGSANCPAFVDGTKYCADHQRQAYRAADSRRGGSDPFYKTAFWLRVRSFVLRAEPLCRVCRAVPATLVDHIIPRADGGADYDPANLQPLCPRCHARKTAHDEASRKNVNKK